MAIVVLNLVGLTPRLLPLAPRLHALAQRQWFKPMSDVLPAVTCTAQATLLTGVPPDRHGIVANGWLYRDTMEVRFWQQSNSLMQAEPLYATAKRRAASQGKAFRCAKMFWWFNQGAEVDFSATPKPFYGIDGGKIFAITGTPEGFTERLEKKHGRFPFFTFWGPKAGLPCTRWIASASATVLREERPDLTLVYLPHLDYDPQRFGPGGCDLPKLVRELDEACIPLLDAAAATETEVWLLSEYGHCDVERPVYLNRALRQAGLIALRRGRYGDQLDLFNSRAFAVCDHQLAHVYVKRAEDTARVRDLLSALPGVATAYEGEERAALGLNHPRAGEIVLLSTPQSWFAYPFWSEDRFAPDYARAVAIHHKPGYDPCELLIDPKLLFPRLRAYRKVAAKLLGFRMVMDLTPLNAELIRGSHGLAAGDPQDGPLLSGTGSPPTATIVPMTAVRDLLLARLGLGSD